MSGLFRKFAAFTALFLLLVDPVVSYKRDVTTWNTTTCGLSCYELFCNSTEHGECACDTHRHDLETCMFNACLHATDYYMNWRELYYKCDLPRPVSTVDPEYTLTAIVLFVVQTLVFMPRIVTLSFGLGQWYKDDISCVVAYILLIAQFVLCVLEGVIGCYVHLWDLDFEKLPQFYKINFARAQLYAITLAVTKMSILFFYQRIFEGQKVQRVLWAAQFFNISLAVAYFIAQCFVSQPLYCEWTFDQGPECTYHDVFDGSGAYSALNAALDLWMVLVAAFLIWKLQMKVTKRLGVIAIFATGFFTFCSALFRFVIWRLSDATKETTFPSLTWATYYAVYIELTCCFIIACLPAIRQLRDKEILPTIKGYTTIISNKYKSSRGSTSTGASRKLVISKTQETRVTSSRFDPDARKDDDWNLDMRDLRTSRQVMIE
ncbi:hypothetical protein FJTKL_01129 [Diaporthe vaccinii]|uniref:Rhodopsin domain-containing protein n=1 Tax=Diaporthe vaccinii TaxID=105482 RepID=A0ABR4F542_9PEZI